MDCGSRSLTLLPCSSPSFCFPFLKSGLSKMERAKISSRRKQQKNLDLCESEETRTFAHLWDRTHHARDRRLSFVPGSSSPMQSLLKNCVMITSGLSVWLSVAPGSAASSKLSSSLSQSSCSSTARKTSQNQNTVVEQRLPLHFI